MAIAACLSGVLGCASAPARKDARAPAPSPLTKPRPSESRELERRERSQLEALEHDLDVSETRLLEQLERKRRQERQAALDSKVGDGKVVGGQPAPRPPKGGTIAPAPSPPPRGDRPRVEPAPLQAQPVPLRDRNVAGAPCDVACRAYKSMRSASARLCELTGEEHTRCRRARQRLERAEQRLVRAGCACIEGPPRLSRAFDYSDDSIGRRISKVEPLPTSLSTEIAPLCRSMIW
jgi:hypothetical protein